MASHLLPISFRRSDKRTPSQPTIYAPSLRTVVMVLVALLILFRWLQLILTLQVASTGRQIQIMTEEVRKIERQNTLLQHAIAEAESPRKLAMRAAELGYRPRVPLYLPLVQPTAGTGVGESALRTGVNAEAVAASPNPGLLEGLGQALGTWIEQAEAP